MAGQNTAGQAALHPTRFAARGHAAHTGESLAASVSDYLITQLKATPASESGSAPELPAATARPDWKS